MTFVASATASSSRSDDDAMPVYRGGGATKKSMPSRRHPLAGFMHRLSTAVPQSSTLTALCFLGLLGVLHEYACGVRPAKRVPLARLVIAAPAALRYENLCIIPARLIGVAGDLCVARRRRCPCIAFSSLLDFTSQDPSANVMVFLGRDTTPIPFSG